MSKEAQVFAKAVKDILEAVMFENWLRFYFITEKPNTPDALFMGIPDQGMQRIAELYPHLRALAEELNGKEITFETSRAALCTFVVTEIDGKRIPRNMADMVFDSSTFQVEMQLFNTWVQGHEAQLDQGFLDFGAWRRLYTEWRAQEAVNDWATQLLAAGVRPQESAHTVQ